MTTLTKIYLFFVRQFFKIILVSIALLSDSASKPIPLEGLCQEHVPIENLYLMIL